MIFRLRFWVDDFVKGDEIAGHVIELCVSDLQRELLISTSAVTQVPLSVVQKQLLALAELGEESSAIAAVTAPEAVPESRTSDNSESAQADLVSGQPVAPKGTKSARAQSQKQSS